MEQRPRRRPDSPFEAREASGLWTDGLCAPAPARAAGSLDMEDGAPTTTKTRDVWTRLTQATLLRRPSGLNAPLVCLLLTMFLLLLGSVQEDALTSDEPMHITAGYASLRFRDARLNPKH